MPYIPKKRREEILRFEHDPRDEEGRTTPKTSGELNFLLTNSCLSYLAEKGLSYTTINEIVGALECAKQEFYRRVAIPYEEKKIIINGDVY